MTAVTCLPQAPMLDRAPGPANPRRPPRLLALTGLAFCVEAVIVARHSLGGLVLAPQSFVVQHGYTVSIFFLLSGFCLTLAHASVTPREYPRFILARLVRIWPLHLAGLCLAILILPQSRAALATPLGRSSLIAHLALVQAWFPSARIVGLYNGPSWFLSALAMMYLLFPLLRHRFERTWPLKFLASVALLAALIVFCNIVPLGPTLAYRGVNGGRLLFFHPLARLPEFVLGMMLALAYQRLPALGQLGIVPAAALELTVIATLIAAKLATPALAALARAIPGVGETGSAYSDMIGIEILPYAALILVLAGGRGPLARLLARRPMVFLGGLTFGIFLTHMPVLVALGPRVRPMAPLPAWPVYLGLWIIFIPLAYLARSLVEIPARRFLLVHLLHMPSTPRPLAWRPILLAAGVLASACIIAWRLTTPRT